MMVAGLGLPLTVALTLFTERRGWPAGPKNGLLAAGIAALALFYRIWPGPDEAHHLIRYLQLSAGLHLLVAFLPFVDRARRSQSREGR
jgi:hypothetical protein